MIHYMIHDENYKEEIKLTFDMVRRNISPSGCFEYG